MEVLWDHQRAVQSRCDHWHLRGVWGIDDSTGLCSAFYGTQKKCKVWPLPSESYEIARESDSTTATGEF